MSGNQPAKSLKAPKNKSREHGPTSSVLVLSDREKMLLEVIKSNGFGLRNILRIALFLEESEGSDHGLFLGPLNPVSVPAEEKASKSPVVGPKEVTSDYETDSERGFETKTAPATARSEVVPGSGLTRRTRIKEARKELLKVLAPEVGQIHVDNLRLGLERLAWLQSTRDWDVMSRNSTKLKDLPSPKVGLIRDVLKGIDLSALSAAKAKAVKASAQLKKD